MNKKLMSLVLAAAFTVSLGSNGFGYSYSSYSDSFNSSFNSRNSNAITVHTADNPDGEARTGFQISIDDAKSTLGGNLTAVFGYYGGTLVSAKQADGQITLYDSYGARFTANNAGGIWTVTNVNLRTSDLAEMEAAGSAEAFLKTMGFTESFLAIADMNDTEVETKSASTTDSEKEEQVTTAVKGTTKSISSGWWQLAIDTLKRGANHSISISEGSGATGPTLTVYENGKQMASYTTDYDNGATSLNGNSYANLRQTAQYIYDDKGFMVGYAQATMEMDESDNGTASGKWIQNVTAITYDANGVRTDRAYKLYDWSNDPLNTVKTGNIARAGQEQNASTIGEETSVTHYSANNSMISSYDYTSKNTTFFANNKASYVVNETGTTVGLYEYSDNGVIQCYFNANGTVEGSDSKVGTTTVYDQWGRSLFTATGGGLDDPNGKNAFSNKSYREQLISEYYDILMGHKTAADLAADYEISSEGNFVPKAGTGTAISSFNIYTEQLFSGNEYKTNGFIDMNKVLNAGRTVSGFTNETLASVDVSTDSNVVALTNLLNGSISAGDSYQILDGEGGLTASGYPKDGNLENVGLDALISHIENSALNNVAAYTDNTNSTTIDEYNAAGVNWDTIKGYYAQTDTADLTAIAAILSSIDTLVAAAKENLDNAISSGSSKADVEKAAAAYARVTEMAASAYDKVDALVPIATMRASTTYTKEDGSTGTKTASGAAEVLSNNFSNISTQTVDAKKAALQAVSYAQKAYTSAARTGSNAQILTSNISGLNQNLFNFGYSAEDIYKMLKFSHGGRTALASTSISMSTWDGDNIPKNADTSNVNYQSVTTRSDNGAVIGSTNNSHMQWSVQSKSSDSKVAAAGISFNNTIMFGGAQAYQTTCNVVTNVYEHITQQVRSESDPAVAGQLWAPQDTQALTAMATKLGIDTNNAAAMADLQNGFYTDATGQSFAIVAADSVNIMDGKGFQAAAGETIMVAVDSTTKASIMNDVQTSGDRSIMFMGDVRESSTGYLTMTMNTSYGGGFIQGTSAVEAAKIEITEKSQAVARARDGLELGTITQSEYEQIVKDAGWVGNNTAANLEMFAKGNFSWDENKTPIQNLRDAWNLLLSF